MCEAAAREPASVRPFEEIAKSIKLQMRNEAMQSALQARIKLLRAKAHIVRAKLPDASPAGARRPAPGNRAPR